MPAPAPAPRPIPAPDASSAPRPPPSARSGRVHCGRPIRPGPNARAFVLRIGAAATRNTRTAAVRLPGDYPDQAVFRLFVQRLTAGQARASPSPSNLHPELDLERRTALHDAAEGPKPLHPLIRTTPGHSPEPSVLQPPAGSPSGQTGQQPEIKNLRSPPRPPVAAVSRRRPQTAGEVSRGLRARQRDRPHPVAARRRRERARPSRRGSELGRFRDRGPAPGGARAHPGQLLPHGGRCGERPSPGAAGQPDVGRRDRARACPRGRPRLPGGAWRSEAGPGVSRPWRQRRRPLPEVEAIGLRSLAEELAHRAAPGGYGNRPPPVTSCRCTAPARADGRARPPQLGPVPG